MNAITPVGLPQTLIERRRHPRFPVALPASLACTTGLASALIFDLSMSGALIETTLLLVPQWTVRLRCGTIDTQAVVAWRKGRQAGLTFTWLLSHQQVTEQMDRSHAIASRRLNQASIRAVSGLVG